MEDIDAYQGESTTGKREDAGTLFCLLRQGRWYGQSLVAVDGSGGGGLDEVDASELLFLSAKGAAGDLFCAVK